MQHIYLSLAAVGTFILVLSLVSGSITRRLYVSEALLALLFGVVMGPHVTDLIDFTAHRDLILENAARITLGVALMATALRLPVGYPFTRWKDLAVMLGPLMVLMWLTTSVLIYFILHLAVWAALLAGAILTPTDPVVAASIVTGKLAEKAIPGRIRNLVSATSGTNDGLGYPFVFLPILMLTLPTAEALTRWVVIVILLGVVGAVIAGGLLGVIAGWLVRWSRRHTVVTDAALAAMTLVLSFAVLGAVRIMRSDSILGVFAAGIAFRLTYHPMPGEQPQRVQEAVARVSSLAMFVLLGTVLPWQQWLALGWKALLLVGAVLLLRQLPSVLVLGFSGLVRSFRSLPDLLFVGWFGPIGISATFYAELAFRHTHLRPVYVVSTLLIFASVVIFGITATPFTQLYSRVYTREEPNQARKSA